MGQRCVLVRDLDKFVRRKPKAELHLHIEDPLEPEIAFAMEARSAVELRFASVAALM